MAGRSSAAAEAEMERKVSVAARNLGDGVQKIVMAAKMGGGGGGGPGGGGGGGSGGGDQQSPDEWKIRLLQLLGGSDHEVEQQQSSGKKASPPNDLDILLENSECDKFVLRCVENELPPNLIHCLRLLRVLELQHAHTAVAMQQRAGRDGSAAVAESVSTTATAKVSRLLCLLCTDPSVGEQLRPHLFGLLALSGASYPPSGVHVASAASDVILAFSDSCLSASLVWFLHDRKMIVHMTDDVKELCGMTAVSSPSSVTLCLYGQAAEAAGLWVVALRTVVKLVVSSCQHQCLELLRDFDAAGGYHVLCYGIANAGPKHIPKLLELVTTLVCCKTDTSTRRARDAAEGGGDEISQADGTVTSELTMQNDKSSLMEEIDDSRLATNPNAFEIVEDLMVRSVPLLSAYVEANDGQRPSLATNDALRELAAFSIETARGILSDPDVDEAEREGSEAFDLASELLVTTLQLYSDHAKNYSIIESRYNILSQYILAFPTFSDMSVKVMILKTLEYVCTGLSDSNSVKPLSVLSEIFFSLCKSLLIEEKVDQDEVEADGAGSKVYDAFTLDAEFLMGTLVKLLQFDESVSHVMVEGGLLVDKIDDFLQLVLESPYIQGASSEEIDSIREPPSSTEVDGVFSSVCSILRLVVRSGAISRSALSRHPVEIGAPSGDEHGSLDQNLTLLLCTGIKDLGEKAMEGSLSVFEAKLTSRHDDSLKDDMGGIVDLLDYFAEITGRCCGVSLTGDTVDTSGAVRRKRDRPWREGGRVDASGLDREREGDSSGLPLTLLQREREVINMLRSVLEGNESAQDAFRISGGFECIIRVLLCLDGAVDDDSETDADNGGTSTSKAVGDLLASILALLGAATEPSRNQKNFIGALVESSAAIDSLDAFSEDDRIAGTPASVNRLYLRQKGLYIALATAISGTGILREPRRALSVVNHALKFMESSLGLTVPGEEKKEEAKEDASGFIRNPDAVRLILGLAVRLPETDEGVTLSKTAFKEIIRLCSTDRSGSSLSQIASSGLISSLTSPKEFAPYLEDVGHPLYALFVLLLRRLASFTMTYMDFVALLRCVAGPILRDDVAEEAEDDDLKAKRIRLPVISSSVRTNTTAPKLTSELTNSETWQFRENDYCNRLETLSLIAERGDRVARCQLGGDSLNTLSLYMQKVPMEERLYKLAEEGRTKFIEIESVDMAAKIAAKTGAAAVAIQGAAAQKEIIWTPFASSGFTFSAWMRIPASEETTSGSIFVLDLSTPPNDPNGVSYLSVWYDIQNQRFNVLSSSSHRNEPTFFPASPLAAGVWHHIFLTFQPPKRAVMSRKSVMILCVDGRPLEVETKVDSILLPPTARMYVGVPNPVLATSGAVRGSLPPWELGTMLLVTTILGIRDATSIFAAGPDFAGIFWGDRPQRLSLAATATATFAMLAESGEQGSVAGALRRRGVPEVEAAGHVMRERGFGGGPVAGPESDLLTAVGLLCSIQPDAIALAFRASATHNATRDGLSSSSKRHFSRRLANLARINSSNEVVATDAVVYGNGSVVSPHSFADNVQWIGGPNVLLPIVNAARSTASMALALRLIRESVHRHPPNLEMLQAGGGYRMLGLLLRQKRIMDANVMEQCFAFAVHGFVPGSLEEQPRDDPPGGPASLPKWAFSDRWVFSDLDAMKYLLLNHQVWDLRRAGPELPLRLLSFLNGLVAAHSAHAAFNSRRLHLLGIIRWTLHLMLEAAELYSAGAVAAEAAKSGGLDVSGTDADFGGDGMNAPGVSSIGAAALASGWICKAPSVSQIAVGGDPDNPLLLGCKTLLRRVLTFMLTPGDLEAIAGAAIYTVSITGTSVKTGGEQQPPPTHVPEVDEEGRLTDEKLPPGPVARVYLLRLLEELVVDGVNEIVTASNEKKGGDTDGPSDSNVQPHAGGGTSSNQSYLALSMMARRRNKTGAPMDSMHPKHQQAQAFLSAFANILTPVWFACVLEGCREEASASAVFRLMILMLQSSPAFAAAFEEAGGFAPLVLSIPKFSTCASITMSMLSQLLHAPILHLPCFGTMNSSQLCEIFDAESDASELIMRENVQGGIHTPSDPSCGIFALLAECLGRNIQLASFDNEMGFKARRTNEAVLHLLSHRHTFSSSFQEFCRTPDFLEPLAQALCLVHDEKLQKLQKAQENSRAIEREEQLARESRREASALQRADSEKSIDILNEEEEDFMAWPAGAENPDRAVFDPRQQHQATKKMARRGSLNQVDTSVTPTERFVGNPEDEGEASGIGMVQLLHLVLSHAVLSGPLAAPLVSALFRSFPIHASPDQVEAFHLVLIEHCRLVVEDALQRGEPIALANCVGVSSVLLDRLMAGFFTSEPVLDSVKIILKTLTCLTSTGSYASRTLGNAEQNMLVADAAHLARLTCLTALQRSRPAGPYDAGDDDLKLAVLETLGQNLRQLLLIPSSFAGGNAQKRQGGGSGFPTPAPGTKFYSLWQSASLTRCCPPSFSCTFPDLSALDEPDRAFVVALMAEIHIMLLDKIQDIREQAVVIVVALLQQRRGIMSELLIADISRGDGRMETVDLMNRGGFGALLVAHEAATIAENISTVPRKAGGKGGSSAGKKYASFFEWLDRNQAQVAAVFHGIHIQASRLLPGFDIGASTPEEAIENEQKVMLLKLTSQDASDRTILGGLERAELAQRSHDKTAESHALWKRQGFDDLSSGAMQWKFLLRQLKGSCSIWEGGLYIFEESPFATAAKLLMFVRKRKKSLEEDKDSRALIADAEAATSKAKAELAAIETVTRWKLDLTEGYERQRRRLLPNYEFFSLYNIDESVDASDKDKKKRRPSVSGLLESVDGEGGEVALSEGIETRRDGMFDQANTMEATAALLREMNLGAAGQMLDEDDYDDEIDEDAEDDDLGAGVAVAAADDDDRGRSSSIDIKGDQIGFDSRKQQEQPIGMGQDIPAGEQREGEGESEDLAGLKDKELASSYDLITGLLRAGDWPEKSYNVKRCTGLEVRQALLLWCRDAIYIIDGFEQTDGEGLEGKINRLEKANTTYYINLRQDDVVTMEPSEGGANGEVVQRQYQPMEDRLESDEAKAKQKAEGEAASEEITYQHRSQRVAFTDLYSVYRRRYQLQHIALEFYDVHRNGTLIAFSTNAEREEVLTKVLSSPLPNSIFSSSILGGSTSINYKKFMSNLRQKITSQWVQGRMTNFDFIMHLNSFAGRTYNDLTQYPVFPWVLADYDSEEIDLNDPSVYRDFSKPMGGQGAERAAQFQERYEALESNYINEDEPPPFHYGTHYSCAAYVLYYLMRLEPFSRLALSLQGGRFDVADRLFHNIGGSWKSASTENLQDVRELIPEFFYLPEFLVNNNNFDFGTTQTGKTVHHVTLPKWAKGDPRRFIRINRQALESEYVSKNLHRWADLIFGFKQRGREAVAALNTFVHVTYEGTVDLDAIEDPIQRESIIAQIQNFGQTPSRLERKPFPARNVVSAVKEKSIDFNALASLAALTPPFCVVGAPHRVYLRATMLDTCRVGMIGQMDSSVGDMCLVKGQLVGVGRKCALILPSKKYYRYGGPNNGVSVHVATTSARHREVNRVLSIHDGMHRAPVNVAKPSLNGLWLVTGCVDSTVRVWRYDGQNVQLRATLCGHEGGKVTCVDVSTTFGTIVTGGADGNVLVWDLRTLTFLRKLRHTNVTAASEDLGSSAISVSVNHKNGNILTLVGSTLSLFDINGNQVATLEQDFEFELHNRPSCAIATDCPEWMENGIVAVTGHVNGDVRLWGLDYESKVLVPRHQLPDKVHSCPITALRVSGDRQDTLLVGDKSGKMSVCKTLQLEALNQQELALVLHELRTIKSSGGYRNVMPDKERAIMAEGAY